MSLFRILTAVALCLVSVHALSGYAAEHERSENPLERFENHRERAAARGFEWEFVSTAEYLYNFDGGLDVGGDLRWDTSLFLQLDTEAAGWWRNGEIFAHLQAQGGNGITDDHVGDFQVLSNIDADDFEQVSEIWYRHRLADGRVWVKFGKMEANEDFAFVEYGGEFLNSSPGFSPTVPLVTYPDQDWGIVLHTAFTEELHVNLGLFQGDNNGGRSVGNTADALRGPKIFLEPSFNYELGDLPGTVRLGAWWNGQELESLNGLSQSDQTWGFYATWDQLLVESDAGQAVGVFAQVGFSSEDYYEAGQYYGAGVQVTAPLSRRQNDVAGIGVFHVQLSDEAGFETDSETTIELYYKLQLSPRISIKPDLQYILNPGGTRNDNSIVAGVRTELSF